MRFRIRFASLNRLISLLYLAAGLTIISSLPRDRLAVRAAACPLEGCKTFLPTVIKIVDQINNGDFEGGALAWKEYSAQGYYIILSYKGDLPKPPHSGEWAAWLGGVDGETASIDQDIYVPAARPYLHVWQWIESVDANCTHDKAWAQINSDILWQEDLCLGTNTNAWVQHSLDLSAYIGQTANLKFWASTDAALGTISSLYLDDVSLQSSP